MRTRVVQLLACLALLAASPAMLNSQTTNSTSLPKKAPQERPGAQSKPASSRPTSEADRVFKKMDDGIYFLSRNGLKDLSFRRRLQGTGNLSFLNELCLHFFWKAPEKYRIEWRDLAGNQIPKPDFGGTKEGHALRSQIEQGCLMESRQLLIGTTFTFIYRDYYKTLKKREVNNKIEYRVALNPKRQKIWAQIVMKIRDHLPVELIKTDHKGRDTIYRYEWERRKDFGNKAICKALRLEKNGQLITEQRYHYIKKGGLLIINRHEQQGQGPDTSKTTTEFENLKVNQGLDDSLFIESKKKSKPTSKPKPKQPVK